jgi:hypothetical protein
MIWKVPNLFYGGLLWETSPGQTEENQEKSLKIVGLWAYIRTHDFPNRKQEK